MADGSHAEQAADAAAAVEGAQALFRRARAHVQAIVLGKDEVIEMALVSVIAGGHLLLEDVPGVGKTTLAGALAGALGGTLSRIQFTSDLLPGDITGVNVLDMDGGGFRFRPGPVFASVVLADEINRATPKTQSALLEAMSERRVTVDGKRHVLPDPFVVLATQNPHDFHGTFPLPDSQLDRFLMRLSIGYPGKEQERAILRSGRTREATAPRGLDLEEARVLCDAVDCVAVHAEVEDLLLELVQRTRTDPRLLRGVSTRGAEALYRAIRALALARGRAFVIPEDLHTLAVPVLAHRVVARSPGERVEDGAGQAIREILWELPAPA